MSNRFEGHITHTADTIKLLYKTEYYTYDKKRILIRMACGAVLAAVALFAGFPTAIQVVLLMLGAWLLVSRDFPSNFNADTAIEARKGNFPTIAYTFTNAGVEIKEGQSKLLPYNQFQRLSEDDRYLYMFLGRASSCMIDKSTVEPKPVEELMDYVEKKTGLQWERRKTFLRMNVYDIIGMFRNGTKK